MGRPMGMGATAPTLETECLPRGPVGIGTRSQAPYFPHGMFPLITNCKDLSLKQTLEAYKFQPKLEKRHEQLKSSTRGEPTPTARGRRAREQHPSLLNGSKSSSTPELPCRIGVKIRRRRIAGRLRRGPGPRSTR